MRFMKAAESRVTFAELQQWPDDGRRYELYDGEVVVVPSPFPRHQRVAMHVGEVLSDHERTYGGTTLSSPIDIVLSEHDVVQPDVVYFRQERRHLIRDWEATRAVPDLAVEVLSRGTEASDRGRKMELLAKFGVPEYWIVDPVRQTLEIHVLTGAAYGLAASHNAGDAVTSPTLPALKFSMARLFAE